MKINYVDILTLSFYKIKLQKPNFDSFFLEINRNWSKVIH